MHVATKSKRRRCINQLLSLNLTGTEPSQAEVGNLDFVAFEQHVRRLEVTVKYSLNTACDSFQIKSACCDSHKRQTLKCMKAIASDTLPTNYDNRVQVKQPPQSSNRAITCCAICKNRCLRCHVTRPAFNKSATCAVMIEMTTDIHDS